MKHRLRQTTLQRQVVSVPLGKNPSLAVAVETLQVGRNGTNSYRASMPDEQASAAPSLRAHLPEKALPHRYDLASSGQPCGQDAALLAIVQEMRRQREQDAKERAEQLKSMREEKSVFTYSLRDDLPVFGDGDSDLDKHLEAFSDVGMVVKPKGDREKLRLFACNLIKVREGAAMTTAITSPSQPLFSTVLLRRLTRRSTRVTRPRL